MIGLTGVGLTGSCAWVMLSRPAREVENQKSSWNPKKPWWFINIRMFFSSMLEIMAWPHSWDSWGLDCISWGDPEVVHIMWCPSAKSKISSLSSLSRSPETSQVATRQRWRYLKMMALWGLGSGSAYGGSTNNYTKIALFESSYTMDRLR